MTENTTAVIEPLPISLPLRRQMLVDACDTETLRILRITAESGFPADVSSDSGSGGSGERTTQPERGVIRPDAAATQARRLLGRIAAVVQGDQQYPQGPGEEIRQIVEDLAEYDPTRAALIRCPHCNTTRDRAEPDCQCGHDPAEIRCANPACNCWLTPGHDIIRNGRCNPCSKYLAKHSEDAPSPIIAERERKRAAKNGDKTSDAKLMPCEQCGDRYGYMELRDGICRQCVHEQAMDKPRPTPPPPAEDDGMVHQHHLPLDPSKLMVMPTEEAK